MEFQSTRWSPSSCSLGAAWKCLPCLMPSDLQSPDTVAPDLSSPAMPSLHLGWCDKTLLLMLCWCWLIQPHFAMSVFLAPAILPYSPIWWFYFQLLSSHNKEVIREAMAHWYMILAHNDCINKWNYQTHIWSELGKLSAIKWTASQSSGWKLWQLLSLRCISWQP